MSTRHDLNARCGVLAVALKNGSVPRGKRKAMRQLLLAVFQAQHKDDPQPEKLEPLSAQVNEALDALEFTDDGRQPTIADDLMDRMTAIHPIKIRSAIRRDLLEQHEATWTDLPKRLDDIVDWFWERCQPREEAPPDGSAKAKAADELGGGDMEYVWGRRKRN